MNGIELIEQMNEEWKTFTSELIERLRQAEREREEARTALAEVEKLADDPEWLYDGNDYGREAVEVADLREVLARAKGADQ